MRRRLPWILFAISLTLNVAIAGAFAWHVWRGEDRMVDRTPIMRAANALQLEGAQREKLVQFRQAARQAFEATRQTVRPLRRELLAELAKPQPDLAAVDRMIDQISAEQAKVQKAMVHAFAEFYAGLTPEQRNAYNKNLRERAGARVLNAIVNPGESGDRGGDRGGPGRRGNGPPNGAPSNAPPNPAPSPPPSAPPSGGLTPSSAPMGSPAAQ